MHGSEPFQRALDEKLDLAQYAAEQLRQIPGIEIIAEPQLSIVAFRAIRPGASNEELNRLNRELLDRVLSSRRVVLSGTSLGEGFVLRLCILSFRTHRGQVDECLELIRGAVESLRRTGEPPRNV
jgi:aromatic-L-amino-acid decarboxylase